MDEQRVAVVYRHVLVINCNYSCSYCFMAGMLMRPGKSEAEAEARCYKAEAKAKRK